VSQSIIASVAERAGSPLDEDAELGWAKLQWTEAMESLGVTYRATHAPLASIGRGWKVCWVADAVETSCPAVMIWAPEQNAYFTLGSLAAAAASSPSPVEAAIRAIVAVAKSTPTPPGLKAALTRDSDFLTLLGRMPKDSNAPIAVGTTGGAAAAQAADAAAAAAGTLLLPRKSAAAEVEQRAAVAAAAHNARYSIVEDSVDEGGDYEVSYDEIDVGMSPVADGRVAPTDDDDTYFRPAPALDNFEWADSREGLRRRPSRDTASQLADDVAGMVFEDMLDEPNMTPGFEDVPGMEGFIADDQVTGQGEFFSRSAGYLSFVDGSWSKEDLAREMGVERHRDEVPVTPRDFPNKILLEDMKKQSEGGADLSNAEDYKELVPHGLPRNFEDYHPLRLHGCDYLVAKTNDGRLDLRDIMIARRREDGNFSGEAERVDTSQLADMPPAYYHEVAWTERDLIKQEKFNPNNDTTEFDTLIANTKKVFLVWAQNPADHVSMYDRQLDFSKPVVSLDTHGRCVKTAVRGMENSPRDGVLVIREGKMYVQDAAHLPNWETVCVNHESQLAATANELGGPDLHSDFLKEVDNSYIPDDTPEVDNF